MNPTKIQEAAAVPVLDSKSCPRETVFCRICGGDNESPYLSARGYRIVRCGECGLWYVNPQPTPEELSQFYATYDDGEQWRARERGFNEGVRRAILPFAQGGALLDVGCGSGDFLVCMREAGFRVQGIEPSRSGSSYAQSVHGIEIFRGMVEDYIAGAPLDTYEVVSLLNVLEHLTDPHRMLLQIRELIRPNGLLAVVVPDARFHDFVGKFRALLGASDPYWLERPKSVLSGFKLPDHLSSFEPRTISLLLQRCGFSIERAQNAPVVLNPQFHRNILKFAVRYIGQLSYYVSLRQFIFGYSTLIIARKRSDPHN